MVSIDSHVNRETNNIKQPNVNPTKRKKDNTIYFVHNVEFKISLFAKRKCKALNVEPPPSPEKQMEKQRCLSRTLKTYEYIYFCDSSNRVAN